ncbi:MAG: response regulator transcription factor [Chitinophagales bacterium]|nr:response regulator transcription factor [Chitinophagales bacterium]
MKIKSIIIDDEAKARQLLNAMLEEYCQDVEVLASCENLPESIKAIKKHQPDLVFLDIEMPGHNGLEILDFFNEEEVNFSIIFTTAYNQFAIQAFKLSAVDYLLKPIEGDALEQSVKRFSNVKQKQNYSYLKELVQSKQLKKMSVATSQSIKFIDLSDILFLKGEGAYTHFHLKNGTELLSSKNLKQYEIMLKENSDFFRCHKSYIINLSYVSDIIKSDGNFVMINERYKVGLSSEKVSELIKILSH